MQIIPTDFLTNYVKTQKKKKALEKSGSKCYNCYNCYNEESIAIWRLNF